VSCSRALSSVSPFYSSLAALSTHVPRVCGPVSTSSALAYIGLQPLFYAPVLCYIFCFSCCLHTLFHFMLRPQFHFTARIAFPYNPQYQHLGTPYTTQHPIPNFDRITSTTMPHLTMHVCQCPIAHLHCTLTMTLPSRDHHAT